MRQVLRVGLLGVGVLVVAGVGARAADPQAIRQAVERGVRALRGMQGANGKWVETEGEARSVGATALAGLTLLECDVSANDPAVQKAAEVVRRAVPTLCYTYS